MSLMLVNVKEVKKEATSPVFKELAAARYIGINRTDFRKLLQKGLIPFYFHPDGKRRIYFQEDLDCYRFSLKRNTMDGCENSQSPTQMKGVGAK